MIVNLLDIQNFKGTKSGEMTKILNILASRASAQNIRSKIRTVPVSGKSGRMVS